MYQTITLEVFTKSKLLPVLMFGYKMHVFFFIQRYEKLMTAANIGLLDHILDIDIQAGHSLEVHSSEHPKMYLSLAPNRPPTHPATHLLRVVANISLLIYRNWQC